MDESTSDGVEAIWDLRERRTTTRTNLLRTASVVFREAKAHVDSINNFRLIGTEGITCAFYHTDARAIDQSLLSRIKCLEIDDSLALSFCFDIWDAEWTDSVWPLVVSNMRRLEHLTVADVDPLSVLYFIEAFTLDQTIFIGQIPEIYVEASQFILPDYPVALHTVVREPKDCMPRLIVPPLRKITWRVYSSQNNWNTLKSVNFRGRKLEEMTRQREMNRLKLVDI